MSAHSSPRLAVVAPGVDLLEGLTALPGADAWISGVGYVEDVELRVAAEGADSTITLRGRFNLLSLVGLRGGPFTVTLSRLSDGGPQVLGGELVRARSAGVNVLMQPASRGSGVTAGKVAGPATWAATAAASAARSATRTMRSTTPRPKLVTGSTISPLDWARSSRRRVIACAFANQKARGGCVRSRSRCCV